MSSILTGKAWHDNIKVEILSLAKTTGLPSVTLSSLRPVLNAAARLMAGLGMRDSVRETGYQLCTTSGV